jgi:hypothetical protein
MEIKISSLVKILPCPVRFLLASFYNTTHNVKFSFQVQKIDNEDFVFDVFRYEKWETFNSFF